MASWLLELIFWIVVFIVFFFGFKRLQNRKKDDKAQEDD
jgi:preprotein translocase subunit YajC